MRVPIGAQDVSRALRPWTLSRRAGTRLSTFLGSRWLKLAAAAALLAVLYFAADWRAVAGALAGLDPWLLAAALALFVPQTLVSALRWRGLVADVRRITLLAAVRQTLAASAFNLVAPSKLGDFSKAAMLPGLSARQRAAAAGRIVLEKVADVTALGAVLLCGVTGYGLAGAGILLGTVLIVAAAMRLRPALSPGIRLRPPLPPGEGWGEGGLAEAGDLRSAVSAGSGDPRRTEPETRRASPPAESADPQPSTLDTQHSTLNAQRSALRRVPTLAAWSLALWLLHVAQIDLFLKAAGVWVAPDVALARLPVAMFAGVVPVSLWGMGTRDAALVWLFADVAPAGTMAAVGLLTTLRYLLPGAAGIPFVARRGT